jgi:hypothetical protein
MPNWKALVTGLATKLVATHAKVRRVGNTKP